MALFGAPVAHEDHAQRACYAALSIQKALENYGEKINKDFGADFKAVSKQKKKKTIIQRAYGLQE